MKGVTVYSTFDIRLRAVATVEHGMPQGQVATAYGIDRTTLYRWLDHYQHNGTNGLYRKEGNGRPTLFQELSETEMCNIVLRLK
jgi:transposase